MICGERSGLARAAERDAVFHTEFRQDLRFWMEADRKTALRILQLGEAALKEPIAGIGKPEPLKYRFPAGPLPLLRLRRVRTVNG
jgi:hypothetical protein